MNDKEREKAEALYELEKKSPALAAVLSLIVVGLGQCYNGEWIKGIACFICCMVAWLILMGWVWNIVASFDAYAGAVKYNKILRSKSGLD